ncbi:LytR/AlgR family response regulator transcription factor [Oceanobacillus sp. FSL H7-0719]|uniref:LytR/AlgR family response regulator transcription factor n=1 Tax=Oceanobacillus sp. FSL H7-0719 TaxID=2954507 RepID=UPI003245751E
MDRVIRMLVVDDEPYNREELKHLLSLMSEVQIIGEAESGEEALMKAIQLTPDVVFLDVEMPKMNGMQAAKGMRELKNPPLIVFATAYPEFAVEAFRYNAIDYLLKPYEEEQIEETVQRIGAALAPMHNPLQDKMKGKLAVQTEGEISYLRPEDILYLSREDNHSTVVTRYGEFETKQSLKELEVKLESFGFFRIHKSFLVNLHYIRRLIPWFNGAYHLELNGTDEKLSVSRNYVKALRAKLEL